MKRKDLFKKGFTLLELIIVIAVIGVIAALFYHNWNVSRDKARVAEVAKNARSMKDYLDVQSFGDKPKIQHLVKLGWTTRDAYKLKNSDNLATTNYFMGDKIPDNSTVYYCKDHSGHICFYLDDKEYFHSFLIYFIGNSTDCSLDEALWMESTDGWNGDRASPWFPHYLYTHKDKLANPKRTNMRRYNRLLIEIDGKNYESNYCMLPVKAPLEVVTK